jgi:hypothetical protein
MPRDESEFIELPDPGDPTTPFPFELPSADWPETLPHDLSEFRRWCERRVLDLRRLPPSLGFDATVFAGKAAHDAWLFATSFGLEVPKPPGLMAPRAALEFLAVCVGRCAEQLGPIIPTSPPGSPRPDGEDEEWLPASAAVNRAERAGYQVGLSWLSRFAEKRGVKTRPRQLTGNHKLEVEWNSLAGYLTRKKADETDHEEPPSDEKDRIEERMKKAKEKKRQDRTPD